MTSIAEACRTVLLTPDPRAKVRAARKAARDWRLGRLAHAFDTAMPDAPARPDRPELLPPNKMPKRGRGGSERARIALIHALAHIEYMAIDLAFDMAGRFGREFPRAFVDDWMRVGAEEAMHFALLARRLEQLGSHYGALPAHAGLWEAAEQTSHDAAARLAIVPMVLEARGLDVTPKTIEQFRGSGDETTARILARILEDEIFHVSVGTRWFERRCGNDGFDVHQRWHQLVNRHFRGAIKAPFNDSARHRAGLTQHYYDPVASRNHSLLSD